jgi:hypothetical protein
LLPFHTQATCRRCCLHWTALAGSTKFIGDLQHNFELFQQKIVLVDLQQKFKRQYMKTVDTNSLDVYNIISDILQHKIAIVVLHQNSHQKIQKYELHKIIRSLQHNF